MNKKNNIKYSGVKQKHISHFQSLRYFEYEIQLDEKRTDIFTLNTVPEWFPCKSVDSAIITASNPKAFPDVYKKYLQDNKVLNKELKIFLEILKVPFRTANRYSLSNKTFEQDGCEKTGAFLVIGITEVDAKRIALQHWQEHFLFFESKPKIQVTLVGCGKRMEGFRETIFPF